MEEFLDPAQKISGVNYYTYPMDVKAFLPLPDGYPYENEEEEDNVYPAWLFGEAYHFENYLPKNFEQVMLKYDNFLIDGSFWNESDNNKTNGEYAIFLSDLIVNDAKEAGIEIAVGKTVSAVEWMIIDDEIEFIAMDFIVKGIYRYDDLDFEYRYLPGAVIPLNAELEFRQMSDWPLDRTWVLINSLDDFKQFASYAKSNNISYTAYIEEDLQLVSLFSSIFAVVSVAILVLSGFIAFIYCGMLINKRLNFIGLIKALGMSDFSIARQFLIMLVVVFGFSFIVGNIFSIFLTSHFAHLALTLFNYELNTGFNIMSQLVFCLLTALTAVLSSILLYRRIKKISIAQTLMHKQ